MKATSMVLMLAGCPLMDDKRGGNVFSAELGPDGGELAGGGLTLRVPPDALSEVQTLTLRVTERSIDGQELLSPVYTLEPEGLTFGAMVEVEVEVDSDDLATLYWSDADDPSNFRFAGFASDGVAFGFTWHFSSAFVGQGVCEAEEAAGEACSCRANDEQGDLLCPVEPEFPGGPCEELDDYRGDDGMSCSGYGPRPIIESWCWCMAENGEYLCPEPFDFVPSQSCPDERGLSGHLGEENGACSGYYIEWDAENNPSNVASSGIRTDCDVITADTISEQVSGTLECIETTTAGASPTSCGPNDGAGSEEPWWNQACLALLDSADTSCVSDAEALATAITAISELFLSENQPGDPLAARHLATLKIPDADEGALCAALAATDPTHGVVDLVRVLPPFDGSEVEVQIAELSPLSFATLPLSVLAVDCLKERIEEAGRACRTDDPSLLSEDGQHFCDLLEANGRKVVLADEPAFSWEPANFSAIELPGIGSIALSACIAGASAFHCESTTRP